MTIDNCTRTRELLTSFHDDELSCELSYQIQDHLNQCDGCRGFARLEQGFTRAMRTRLSRVDPPEGIFERVRRQLDRVDDLGEEEDIETLLSPAPPVVSTSGTFARLSGTVYTAAAVLIAGLLLVPAFALFVPGVARQLFEVTTADGTIVCFECARAGAPIEMQKNCHEQGHSTGILCEQTGLWHLVANDRTLALLSDPSMRGRQVLVEGEFLDRIRYIDARSVTTVATH